MVRLEQCNHPSCADSDSIKKSTMESYDRQWMRQDEDATAERRRRLSSIADPLLSMVNPLSGKVVLDLGIGTGSLAFRALELSPPKAMIGIDFSGPGLCVARSISKHAKFNDMDIELVRADLERMPIASRSIDVVLSQATLNLLPDKRAVFSEISRVCKSGARIAVSDAFKTSFSSSEGSWEQCIGGTITVSEFSTFALNAGLIILGQTDLTKAVKELISAGKWDWPEFLEYNMDYRAFMMMKSG